MALSGAAKIQYQREYMRRKRNAGTAKPGGVPSCDFCGEDGSSDRILISDYHHAVMICEHCVAAAVDRIAEVRGR